MDPNERVRRGAGVLLKLVSEINPVLYPELGR